VPDTQAVWMRFMHSAYRHACHIQCQVLVELDQNTNIVTECDI